MIVTHHRCIYGELGCQCITSLLKSKNFCFVSKWEASFWPIFVINFKSLFFLLHDDAWPTIHNTCMMHPWPCMTYLELWSPNFIFSKLTFSNVLVLWLDLHIKEEHIQISRFELFVLNDWFLKCNNNIFLELSNSIH